MDLGISRDGARVVVRLGGELDASCAPRVDAVTDLVSGPSAGAVELDLRGLTFLDCAGLRALRALAGRVRDAGATLTCTCPAGEPRSLIELVGADADLALRHGIGRRDADGPMSLSH